jgi:phosphate transport system substrate-binding protein
MKTMKILEFIPALILLFFFGCTEPAETPTKGNIIVGVDESVYPLMVKEKDSFQSKYPDSKIKLEEINLHDGIVNFINGKYKMFIGSRKFNKSESDYINSQKLYVRTFKFCFEGIAVITSKRNSINEIKLDDLKELLSGKLNNYTAVLPEANSGVYAYIKDSLMNGSSTFHASSAGSEQDVIKEIINSKNKIGFVGSNSIQDSSRIKILQVGVNNYPEIDYYQPHPGYFLNDVYPLSRTIYIFLNETGLGLASGFTTYLTSYQGQKIVLSQDLAPAAVPVKLNQYKAGQ